MKVIHTIAGTRLDHGGTSRSVPALCEAIQRQGADVHFLTTKPADAGTAYNLPGSPVIPHLIQESRLLGRFGLGRQYFQALNNVRQLDGVTGNKMNSELLIHDHGVWLAPNHTVAAYARRHNLHRVVSPRGMLSAWAINRGKWKKRLAWWGYQLADLRSATAFHVTAMQEAEEVRSLGFRQPIAVIPNGISFADRPYHRERQSRIRRILFLSRIHPKKGLIELVRAWKAANVSSDWELIVAGPNESGHQQQVESVVRELGLTGTIHFPGSIDDAAKWQAYADADLFVLPSFSENFGLVIAEALAAGLPVITTTGTPWDSLPERGCGWWVEPTANELARVLAIATALPSKQLVEMGQVGSRWARSTFTWDAVGRQMIDFYRWIQGNSPRPEYVDVCEAGIKPSGLEVG